MSDLEQDPPEKPPVSIWKRLLLASGLFVLVMIGLSVGWFYLQGASARSELQEALARLDENDPGWRLEDLEAARLTLPDESNSALTVMAVHRLLPGGALNAKRMEPLDALPPLSHLLDDARAALLERELTSVAAAVIEARKLAEMPNGRHPLVIAPNPMNTLLPHAQDTRAVGALLRYDVLRLAQKGDAAAALRSCRAILNAGRSFDDEPFFISQLVRMALVAIAADAAERALALGEPPPDELARFQELLEAEEKHPTLLVGLRGERAMMHRTFTGVADGSISAAGLAASFGTSPPSWQDQVAGWTMKGMIYRDHPRMLALMGRAIDNARAPPHDQPAAEKAHDAEIRKLPEASLARLLIPAVTKVGEGARRKLAFVRCLTVLTAVERHRQEKGEWPARLDDLTPKLLASVPIDPFDGKPLRCRRVADGVIVYSVGPDGKDDGGDIDHSSSSHRAADMGFRLWDVKQRRKPAKAVPAVGK